MDAPELFRDLEWQVARVRRAFERYDARESEQTGKGRALIEHAMEDLDRAAIAWVEAGIDTAPAATGEQS